MGLYRGMDSKTLKAAYDNTAAVSDFPAVLAGMQGRSETFYKQNLSGQKDVSYGPNLRAKLDYIPANEEKAPTFIFIHGGYWQATRKEDFAFVAKGPLSLGCHVILLEYTLAPDAGMTKIVEEIELALDYIDENADRFNIQRGNVCLAGHSAGAHLTAVLRGHPLISSALMISPIVDLEPIQKSWLNEALMLTDEEVEEYSPIDHVKKGVPTDVVVGDTELPELIRHAREYHQALIASGNVSNLLEPIGHTHFTVLDELASTSGVIVAALTDLIDR